MLTEEQGRQGSPEWLELRRTKIGASDIAKIMGVSPYGSPYTLWQEKTGRKQVVVTEVMKMGSLKEESIRQWYEKITDDFFLPSVMVSETYSFAMASLDGISMDGKRIIECKWCNKDVFNMAKEGHIAPHYLLQCQWQLMCAPEAKEVHFICYNAALADLAVVITKRDEILIDKMARSAKVFYEEHLLKDVPPESSPNDYVVIDDVSAVSIASQLHSVMVLMSDLKTKEKRLREALFSFSDDGNFVCDELKVTRSNGNISYDYKQACLDNNIDLEKYRKKSIGFWTVRLTSNITNKEN